MVVICKRNCNTNISNGICMLCERHQFPFQPCLKSLYIASHLNYPRQMKLPILVRLEQNGNADEYFGEHSNSFGPYCLVNCTVIKKNVSSLSDIPLVQLWSTDHLQCQLPQNAKEYVYEISSRCLNFYNSYSLYEKNKQRKQQQYTSSSWSDNFDINYTWYK